MAGCVYLGDLDGTQRFMLGSLLVLLFHEAEEWAWPGGEPAILNTVIPRLAPLRKMIGADAASSKPDRYPSNANSAMVVNVFAAYPIYILGVNSSDQIWYGLFAVFFWIGQLIFHGVITNSSWMPDVAGRAISSAAGGSSSPSPRGHVADAILELIRTGAEEAVLVPEHLRQRDLT